MNEDTICAPATPPVNSPIAIIRISGSGTLGAVKAVFSRPEQIKPRYAAYGNIIDRDGAPALRTTGNRIDDVILIYYRSPGSFTGEDMAEIFCHGNRLVLHRILRLLVAQGIRIAEPGEFSKRAFLNGKIGLTEAEAVHHLICARSEWEIDTALGQMHGSLHTAINRIRDDIILLKADIEAGIDFIEEDIEFVTLSGLLTGCTAIQARIDELLKRCVLGEKLTRGIDIIITGKPNVGKSSILNLILNRERALVSEIPGTTRDLIQEQVQMGGMLVNLIDSAGIGHPRDEIERMGIELSNKNIELASIVIMVFDASSEISTADKMIMDKVRMKKTIYCINKIDIAHDEFVEEIQRETDSTGILFSARTGEGFKELESGIVSLLRNEFFESSDSYIADFRVIDLLEKSLSTATNISTLINEKAPAEITAFELQVLIDLLCEITGEITPDDILDSIFSRFCMGK